MKMITIMNNWEFWLFVGSYLGGAVIMLAVLLKMAGDWLDVMLFEERNE